MRDENQLSNTMSGAQLTLVSATIPLNLQTIFQDIVDVSIILCECSSVSLLSFKKQTLAFVPVIGDDVS